jgi:hypothetical protein
MVDWRLPVVQVDQSAHNIYAKAINPVQVDLVKFVNWNNSWVPQSYQLLNSDTDFHDCNIP